MRSHLSIINIKILFLKSTIRNQNYLTFTLNPLLPCRFESCWPALMKDSHGVVIIFNADIPSHLKEIEMWYSCFVQQQFLQDTQCLLIAHHKPGSGSGKGNLSLCKEAGILLSAFVSSILGICILLCVFESSSYEQLVSTYCVLGIYFSHHVNQNCQIGRSAICTIQARI